MPDVAALFVDASSRGIYPHLLGSQCWGEAQDARLYRGPDPVVAHPPCQLWVNMAAVNWKRYGRQRPAWYPGGDDGGCFASALASVRRWGGVLEHPAGSHAWAAHDIGMPSLNNPLIPSQSGWVRYHDPRQYWVCEVWQSAYGHRARKRTWLLYCGKRPPFELDWTRKDGTHAFDSYAGDAKPPLGKRERSATPERFARELIRLAEWSRG